MQSSIQNDKLYSNKDTIQETSQGIGQSINQSTKLSDIIPSSIQSTIPPKPQLHDGRDENKNVMQSTKDFIIKNISSTEEATKPH